MKHQGSVLLISLVLLLILTVAGLTVISSSSLEEKITGNYRDQKVAFHAAETALMEAEDYVEKTSLVLTDFTSTCGSGLCFSGTNADDIATCTANEVSPWLDSSVWDGNGKTKTVTLDLEGVIKKAQYIIEFRCYLPRDIDGPEPDITHDHDWAQFFRITVLAGGGSEHSRVMLQTTYKKNSF